MKLMKDTGSLTNWLLANPNYVQPKVGDGVTEMMWTDRHAWLITAVDDDNKGFTMTRLAPKLIGSYYEQNYQYKDENDNYFITDRTEHIRWKYKGWHYATGGKVHLRLGYVEEYEDPSF